jgi:hypothetical protein
MRRVTWFGFVLFSLSAALLTSCGGGGGSSTPAASINTTLVALNLADTFTTPLTGSGGRWTGDGLATDGGFADAGGGAGDGEFIKVHVNFPYSGHPNGALTWTVLRSQYGINGATGTLTIQADPTSSGSATGNFGGYLVTASVVNGVSQAVSAGQQKIFVSSNGLITGTVPLPIGGGSDVAFTVTRFAEAPNTSIANVAGQYAFASMYAAAGTGANPEVGHGVININADGTGRICAYPATTYSASCSPGVDVLFSYLNSVTYPGVVQITLAPTQSTSTNTTALNSLMIFKSFGSGNRSFIADFANIQNGPNTGVIYGSLIGAIPVNPASYVGTFSGFVYANFSASNLSGVFKKQISGSTGNFSGNVVRSLTLAPFTNYDCTTARNNENVLTAGPNYATINSIPQANPSGTPTYHILLDTDAVVFVETDSPPSQNNIGFITQTSTTPGATGCAPL